MGGREPLFTAKARFPVHGVPKDVGSAAVAERTVQGAALRGPKCESGLRSCLFAM